MDAAEEASVMEAKQPLKRARAKIPSAQRTDAAKDIVDRFLAGNENKAQDAPEAAKDIVDPESANALAIPCGSFHQML